MYSDCTECRTFARSGKSPHVAADKRQCEIKTYVLNKRMNRITAKQNLAAGARIRGACPESDNGANVLGGYFSREG